MERRESRKFLNFRYWSCRVLLQVLVLAGLCGILYKAFRLQIVEHAVWVERAHAQLTTTFQVPAYRGSIVDRQGRLLSYSVPQRSLYVDGEQVENPKKIATRLAPILGEPEDALAKKLTSSRHFVWVKRQLTDQQAIAVEGVSGRGLNLTDEYKRFYPYRQVGGQVVGFVGMDGAGLEGIEKSFDDVLRGKTIPVGQLRDGVRKCIWVDSSMPPGPAESWGVKLTLDTFIQYVAELELEKAVTKYRAKSGEAVVMDAQSGEVLAMVNWPFFDPNIPDKKDAQGWRNRTVTDSFEPGSTFKVFTISSALEEGTIREQTRIFCENGKCNLASHVIKDVHPFGLLTIPEVIKYSSNIGAAKIALALGSERLYRHIRGFGFGSLSDIQLPGEVKGLVRPYKRWRPIDLAVTGFGQAIGVTSLQLTGAISVIANEGQYIPPIIAKEILDAEGKPIKEFHSAPVRTVIQKKTANQMRDMMALVTQEGGTGVKAAPEGYNAAGKTGTAQVMDPATKHYATNKYTAVFTGFIPVEKPKLVITVVIHEPQGSIYGGVVAAPVFCNIAAKSLPYLGIMPSSPSPAPGPAIHMVKTPPAQPGTTHAVAKTSTSAAKSGGSSSPPKQANLKKDSTQKNRAPGAVSVNAGKEPLKQKPAQPVHPDPPARYRLAGRQPGLD